MTSKEIREDLKRIWDTPVEGENPDIKRLREGIAKIVRNLCDEIESLEEELHIRSILLPVCIVCGKEATIWHSKGSKSDVIAGFCDEHFTIRSETCH